MITLEFSFKLSYHSIYWVEIWFNVLTLVKDEAFFSIKEGGDGKFTLNKNTTQLRTPNLSELITILSHEMLVHI
jgi:phage-related protein